MESAHAGRLRVLLVDDDASVCELVGDVFDTFAHGRFDLTCVTTDSEAYKAIAEESSFDPIVVDINLRRGTTGYDVARRARAIRPAVKIVYISGEIDARSVATHGVPRSTFLAKPFTPERLLEALSLPDGATDD